ncbi:tellurite resistance protein [Rhizomicrobium palustre]|uniref:Tellurite resistance protein n=1 Tax=Rhizomicrobium palustre TaxID=189966 RepID=A0A846MUB2_9PROT|nr:dicarboxylate transporter/tellurite-resistance protein TehA [Rhizomicrobium palustre]NIK87098.1 tellurite resistance protein [Rhizomicrobium palustre]
MKLVPAAFFGMVLGLSGIGQSWRLAAKLWQTPPLIGEIILGVAGAVWASLLLLYLVQAIRAPKIALAEIRHPVQGAMPALIGISTLLMVMAVVRYNLIAAWILAAVGVTWHMGFALYQTGAMWQGGRAAKDSVPSLYLPTVAGNFTSAAALGALGHADWGWLFLGAGVFSWLALESSIVQRLWQPEPLPASQRPLLGIQFAPPVVCAMAWLMLAPGSTDHWLLMLLGYGLFQLLLGLRLWFWLGEQSFAPSYWAYTFGIASTTVATLKLAISGISAAQILAPVIFLAANLFIGTLAVRTAYLAIRGRLFPAA